MKELFCTGRFTKQFLCCVILLLIIRSIPLLGQETEVTFADLDLADGKCVDQKCQLEFEKGNMLFARHWERSVLDTMQNAESQGSDKEKNRYYFMRNPLNISGVMMLDKELGAYVYCDRYSVAIVDLDRSTVKFLRDKNCGVDVVAFDNCGFYDFRYSPETKELYYLEKRLTLPDRTRSIYLGP